MRPSLLLGNRIKKRFGEEIGKIFIKVFSPFLIGKFKKYQGVQASDVAIRMIKIADQPAPGCLVIESDKI